ncbi:MAG: TetR/AcrR family transcriptional regulator [Myxococcota bacterium]
MNHRSGSPSKPSKAKRAPATARGAKTRAKIIRAAETVFGGDGYERGSIADIAREADVALGTFYIYFPDKKSAFIELVDELGRKLRRDLGAATAGLEHRVAVERAGLRAFLEFTASHRGLYRIVRQAEFVDEPTYRRYYEGIAGRYAEALERAMDDGQIRRLDPETLAYCLMGLADFLGMRWVLWGQEDDDVERTLAAAASFLEHGLAAAPAPAPRRSRPRKGTAP